MSITRLRELAEELVVELRALETCETDARWCRCAALVGKVHHGFLHLLNGVFG